MRYVWEALVTLAVVGLVIYFGGSVVRLAVWAWWDDMLASRRAARERGKQAVSELQKDRETDK